MPGRAQSFGTRAQAYERYRPGYPRTLLDAITAYAGRPLRTALEIGAGTGKATRLFTAHGITVTATDPDPAMLAELRKHLPGVRTVRAAFEELQPDGPYDLVYAAAALHWTDPRRRWERLAQFLPAGGVFASFGGPISLTDPAVAEAVATAQAPWLDTHHIPSPDGTPPDAPLQWPGTELQNSPWFTDIQQSTVERRLTMSRADYLGHLSTVSAYLILPDDDQEEVFTRIEQVLPDTVDVTADLTLHLARRTQP